MVAITFFIGLALTKSQGCVYEISKYKLLKNNRMLLENLI